jgi:hypothetical protein
MYTCGNPAIHMGHHGSDLGSLPAACFSLALRAVHQNLACTFCSAICQRGTVYR